MSKDDARTAPAGVARLEPRDEGFGLRLLRRSLGAKHQAAFRIDIAQARETVRNETQALFAFEAVLPAIRLVSVQSIEQLFGIAPQGFLQFMGAAARLVQVPLRGQPGVHHAHVQSRVLVHQRTLLQPFEQRGAIRRGQNVIERVIAALARTAINDRQQVQIVIAEDDRGGIAQSANPAQDFERIGAAIDQVADEPDGISIGGEFQGTEQCAEFRVASLHISDRV